MERFGFRASLAPNRRFATTSPAGIRLMEPKVVALRLIRTVPSDREGRICLAGTFHQLFSSPGEARARACATSKPSLLRHKRDGRQESRRSREGRRRSPVASNGGRLA